MSSGLRPPASGLRLSATFAAVTRTARGTPFASQSYDVYFLEAEWRAMLAVKQSVPDSPTGSVIAYVKWYVGEHGRA